MEMRSKDGKKQRNDGERERISTIYLGGGTPSLLSEANLHRLFDAIGNTFSLADLKETTIECNPDDVTEDYASMLSRLPVNRVSMGAQTFSDDRLHFLHRRHTAEEVGLAVERLRNVGIENISIDLMFGFPGETLDDWQQDINAALSLDVEHISAYCLMYEEGTPLYRMANTLKPIDDETERLMYDTLIDRLSRADYEHYEISNFARVRKSHDAKRSSLRSLHNSNYWNSTPYIGLGAAAHSFDIVSRQWNISNIHTYIESIEQGIVPCEREIIDADTRYNDLITTALRTREGIILSSLKEKYRHYLLDNAKSAIERGLLTIDDDRIHLTRQGLFVSDDVMSDLVWV
jgi:oxygen-independent coproporphyrinogen-3 oxidase